MKYYLLLIALVLGFSACEPGYDPLSGKKNSVVCTTGIIGDVAKKLVGDSAEVISLMGPGVDPHLYKASQGDIAKLTNADVVVYNGLHLEGKMTQIFRKLENSRPMIRMSEGISEDQLINLSDYAGAYDPHIWFDVELWKQASLHLAKELKEQFPQWETMITENSQELEQELTELDNWIKREIEKIPEQQRVLITAHDAFKYFGEKYGIEVRGLQGISTAAEYGIRDISQLVSYITDNEIKAIFIESSVPKRSINAVVEGCRKRGHNVKIGGELYSDALGAANTPAGNYKGMVQHNVSTIVEALTERE